MNNDDKRPIIIGVTGGSGSGKTTVSRAIYNQLHGQSIQIITQDTYYKQGHDVLAPNLLFGKMGHFKFLKQNSKKGPPF